MASSKAYDVLRVETDRAMKRPSQVVGIHSSHHPTTGLSRSPLTFYIASSDNSVHSYAPSSGSLTELTFWRWHQSYPSIGSHIHVLNSWGVLLAINTGRIVALALPLHHNPSVEGGQRSRDLSGRNHISTTNSSGSSASSVISRRRRSTQPATRGAEPKTVVEFAKDIQILTADEENGIACAVSKQSELFVFHWSSRRLRLELHTKVSLQDMYKDLLPVTRLLVIDDRYLCLVFQHEWKIVDMENGEAVISVFPGEGNKDEMKDLEKIDGNIYCTTPLPSGAARCAYSHTSTDRASPWMDGDDIQRKDVFIANTKEAVVLSLIYTDEHPDDSNAFNRFATNSNVRVKVSKVLEYNEPPRHAFVHTPYLLLDFRSCVRVYSLGSMAQVQEVSISSLYGGVPAVPLDSTTTSVISDTASVRSSLSAKAPTSEMELPPSFFTISPSTTLHMLQMQPLPSIVEKARQENRLEEAVSICELCPSHSGVSPIEKQVLYSQYANDVFHKKQDYPLAMRFFRQSQTPIETVLELYPRELLPRSLDVKEDHTCELDGEELVASLLALVTFLQKHKRSSGSMQEDDTSAFTATSDNENIIEDESTSEVAIIDTVLMKVLVALSEKPELQRSAEEELKALVTAPNLCDVSETELYLLSHHLDEALLAFYATRHLHQKALELLEDKHRCAISEEDTRKAHQLQIQIAEYLQSLDRHETELICAFSRGIIATNPPLGLSIFTQRKIPFAEDDMEPSDILEHLKTCSIEATEDVDDKHSMHRLPLINSRYLAIEYLLQLIVSRQRLLPVSMHDEAVYLLLDAIKSKTKKDPSIKLTPRVSDQTGLLGILRRRLLQLMELPSAAYRPERMLAGSPASMVDERAALLSRLGRHDEVLELYAIGMQDASLAEAYCNRCFETNTTDASVYSTLLRLYLAPSSSVGNKVGEAVALLNKYADRIDVSTALELIPSDEVSLQALLAFFKRVLETQVERHRNGQVRVQLAKMGNFKVRQQLAAKRKQSVTIWTSQACHRCGDRLGTGTFVRMPNGTLLHYGCRPGAYE